MRIVYDYQIFTAQAYGGISRYYCALAPRVNALPGMSARIVAPLHQNSYLRHVDPRVAVGRYLPRWPRTGRLVTLADSLLFPAFTRRLQPDVVHETFFSTQPTYRGGAVRVLTVLDMINERFPESFPADYPVASWKAAAVKRADHIICISESTRRDLLAIHPVSPERVSVIHLGYDRLAPGAVVASAIVGTAPYFLFVGGRSGYKDFIGLARAYASAPSLRGYRIVCIGGGAVTPEERRELDALGLGDERVQFVKGDDEVLAALYLGATALVYPSRYEGFGIPLLEAMALGCPVISSDAGSLPEVAGDAVEYFAAGEVDDLRRALETVAGSETRRAELRTLGERRATAFSWDRCARETAQLYRTLVPA